MCLRRRVPLLSLSFRLPFVFPQVTGNWVNSISPYGRHLLLFFCPRNLWAAHNIFPPTFFPLKYFPSFLSAYVYPHCTMYVRTAVHSCPTKYELVRPSVQKKRRLSKTLAGRGAKKIRKRGKRKKLRRAFFLCHRESLMSLFFPSLPPPA